MIVYYIVGELLSANAIEKQFSLLQNLAIRDKIATTTPCLSLVFPRVE